MFWSQPIKVKNAISNAKDNASLNGIKNTHYYAGNTSDIIKKLNVKFDTIILDPPRVGLSKKVINNLLNIKANKIIYVSCDSVTLSRDIKLLSSTYNIDSIKLFDMFPNTYHVESVILLQRKD